MTPRRWLSTFPEAAATAVLVGALLAPRAARAQACCVGTGLVTPARLRVFEAHAVGFQTRVRSVTGAFGDGGGHAASPPGDDELDVEQDLFAATRVGPHLQGALQIPFVETGRRESGLTGWGGGVGDVSANARYDLVMAGDRPRWPGLAILAGVSLPTGRPVDAAGDPLATSATGTGSFEGNVGLAVERVLGNGFLAASGWIAQRTARSVGGINQSFAPRLTALVAGGYTFRGDVTGGAFLLGTRQGNAHDQVGSIPASDVALVTAGVAGAVTLGDAWRLQGNAFADLPLPGWGRNQTTGLGLAAALLKVWL